MFWRTYKKLEAFYAKRLYFGKAILANLVSKSFDCQYAKVLFFASAASTSIIFEFVV